MWTVLLEDRADLSDVIQQNERGIKLSSVSVKDSACGRDVGIALVLAGFCALRL